MHSKYDNIHKNGMFKALMCINNHIIVGVNCTLSMETHIMIVLPLFIDFENINFHKNPYINVHIHQNSLTLYV